MRPSASVEVWGGMECSRVRIGSRTRNQIVETGHADRSGDLDLIAELGIKTLRHPVLLETVAERPGERNWLWHDSRLLRLRSLGIAPIAGLVHHGSGPDYCDMLDPGFPALLAGFAQEVAARYPWIDRFTPINEPMTTARLCSLYGHWHPHGRDEGTCFRFVVAECKAIAMAMKAIRRITPGAMLIQTEDIGHVFAVPALRYQADHENERRWLALDLLCGRVDRNHPFHRRLLDYGVDERSLAELVDQPCPPDVIGIDQYLTSDRFLDDRIDRHPGEQPGGNGRHAYVDVAAPRAEVPQERCGFLPRIREAWQRYGLPLAITEVHNGCTREEQLRWLMEGWNAALEARREGTDIRAVTAWSLFGALDWASLLARREGAYEPGAFDARFDPPRPTAVAAAVRGLARSHDFDHPVLTRPGWWRPDARNGAPRLLLLAGSPDLGRIVSRACALRRLDVAHSAPDPDGLLDEGAAWAFIEEEGSDGRGLKCRYGSGGDSPQLALVAGDEVDRGRMIEAFLDLVVDRAAGRYRMTQAGPGGAVAFTTDGASGAQPHHHATRRRMLA